MDVPISLDYEAPKPNVLYAVETYRKRYSDCRSPALVTLAEYEAAVKKAYRDGFQHGCNTVMLKNNYTRDSQEPPYD